MKMSTNGLAAVVTAMLLVPIGLSGQGQHRAHHPDARKSQASAGMMGGMMAGQMDMTLARPGPRMLLRQREALGLTDGQIAELERLQTRADELRSSHRSEMTSLGEEIASLRSSDELDLDRYRSLLLEQADLRVEMQVRMAEIREEALTVLDEEQRSNLRYGMRLMRSGTAGGGMMGGPSGAGSAMMGMMGGMDHGGMMQMMSRMHRQMHGQDCPMTPARDTEGEG